MKLNKNSILYFGIQAEVIGDFDLIEPVISYSKGFQVKIFIEDGARKLSLIKKVGNNSDLKIKISIQNGESKYVIPDEKSYIEYINFLKRIESIAGFNYGIKKVLYNSTLELIWYNGTDVFENLNPILSIKRKLSQPNRKILSQSNLNSILLLEEVMPDAVIPYNLYREGVFYLKRNEFRLAYLHFYMIFEFCFIKGNYTEKGQIKEYLRSQDVIFAIYYTIKLYKEHNIIQFNWLINTVKDRFNKFTIRNILIYLFRCRGEIAHGTKKCGEYLLNENELYNITNFIHKLCFTLCGNMQVYCEAFTKFKDERIGQRLKELKDELENIFDPDDK